MSKNEKNNEIIEEYPLDNCKAKINVIIGKKTNALTKQYHLSFPEIGEGTRISLDEVKIEILSLTKTPVEKMIDPKFAAQVKKDFTDIATKMLKQKVVGANDNLISILVEILMHEMLGLGNIEYILLDDNIEEIVVNSANSPFWVYHKKYGWLKTNMSLDSEKDIENLSSIIARRSGKQVNVSNPLLDAHLPSGDRANSTLSPISSNGNTITIRRFRRKPWTVTDLISAGSVTSEAMALIWTAFEYELNILVSGGTASGKTSFLNACIAFIRPNQRILTIEDTRELTIPEIMHWVPLTTRAKNTEGEGEVTMLDLLVNSLRMRPDRIIVGEVRRQREAEVMFEAMNTGHSVYTTFHADTADETIRRFSNPPISIPQGMLDSISLNITLFRNRKTGKRAVYQISEIIVEDRGQNQEAKPNVLYRYNAMQELLRPQKKSVKFFDEISMHTGLTANQIEDELKEKQIVLEWMIKKNVNELADLQKLFAQYYLDKDKVFSYAKQNKPATELIESFEA